MAEGSYPKSDGDVLYASEVNLIQGEAIGLAINNKIRQDIDRAVSWDHSAGILSEGYVSSVGRYNMQVSFLNALEFNSTDTTYQVPDFTTNPYIIIEATDIFYSNRWTANDCKLGKIDTGKWIFYATSGTAEERRAKMMNTLFGYFPAILDVDTPTAIKTSVSRDVGKRAHFIQHNFLGSQHTADVTIDGTFANTTDNDDCSSWSYVGSDNVDSAGDSDVDTYQRWYIPAATLRHEIRVNGDSSGATTEFNTDTTADENDNPSDCKITFVNTYTSGHAGPWRPFIYVLILAKGGLTWSTATPVEERDYNSDFSIPDFTAATLPTSYVITHAINDRTLRPQAPTRIIGKSMYKNYESGVSVKHRLSDVTFGVSGQTADCVQFFVSSSTQSGGTFPSNFASTTSRTYYTYGSTVGNTKMDLTLYTTNDSTSAYGYTTFYYEDGTNATAYTSAVTSTGFTYTTGTMTNPNSSKPVSYLTMGFGRHSAASLYDKNDAKRKMVWAKNFQVNSVTLGGSSTTSWFNEGEMTTFTALSNPPRYWEVQLNTKTSSPTTAYPSIYGTGVYYK